MQARSRSNVNPQPLLFWLYRTGIVIDTRLLIESKCMDIESRRLSKFSLCDQYVANSVRNPVNLKRAPFHA